LLAELSTAIIGRKKKKHSDSYSGQKNAFALPIVYNASGDGVTPSLSLISFSSPSSTSMAFHRERSRKEVFKKHLSPKLKLNFRLENLAKAEKYAYEPGLTKSEKRKNIVICVQSFSICLSLHLKLC
jgi:hypothetical protein